MLVSSILVYVEKSVYSDMSLQYERHIEHGDAVAEGSGTEYPKVTDSAEQSATHRGSNLGVNSMLQKLSIYHLITNIYWLVYFEVAYLSMCKLAYYM